MTGAVTAIGSLFVYFDPALLPPLFPPAPPAAMTLPLVAITYE